MADSGGSSGRLRDELGVLPPGDVLKALLALSSKPYARDLLLYRFNGDLSARLHGHTVGNLFLSMMSQFAGDYLQALTAMEQLLDCQGKVLPASLDKANLVATIGRGEVIVGEGRIESWIYRQKGGADSRIKSVSLQPAASILPAARDAIRAAHLVVIGPGSFFTSLMAVLDVGGLISELAGKKIAYVVNLTTNHRETPRWKASRFLAELERKLARKVDYAVCNTSIPEQIQSRYREEGAGTVKADLPTSYGKRLILCANLVPEDSVLARHDPMRLATLLVSIL